MYSPFIRPWLVTVEETVHSIYRVYASSAEGALGYWRNAECVSASFHRRDAEALSATPETPIPTAEEALAICIERLELNDLDGSEREYITTAKQALLAAQGGQR